MVVEDGVWLTTGGCVGGFGSTTGGRVGGFGTTTEESVGKTGARVEVVLSSPFGRFGAGLDPLAGPSKAKPSTMKIVVAVLELS